MIKKRLGFRKGFTLIELMVVIAIIAILAAAVLAVLSSARDKGSDAGVKADMVNAMKQAEIFYNTNTNANNTYTRVCDTSPVGGAVTAQPLVLGAAKAAGLNYDATNGTGRRNPAAGGVNGNVTCNDSAASWAAEVPLKTTIPAAKQMWCVDSTGRSVQTTGTTLGIGDYNCN